MRTPQIQLFGSIATIVVVLSCGLLGVPILGEKLDGARLKAEQARNRVWIRSVVSELDNEIAATDPEEFSDPVRLGTERPASIVTLRDGGVNLTTAMKLIAPAGYNGDIEIALAVDEQGTITGLKILSHQETPGFGDVISNADAEWIVSFLGRSLKNPATSRWQLRTDDGDIDGITGATITASAVVAGIYRALNYIDQTNAGAH